MAIKHWPATDRPREKLLEHGAKSLTDTELIAIFLQTGIRGKTALDLARDLLAAFGGLKQLLSATQREFLAQKGLGPAKYVLFQAAIELTQRTTRETLIPGTKITSNQTAQRFIIGKLGSYPHEVFACLFLDNQHRVICFEELFTGTLHEAAIYPREVVKRGLAHNAAKVILCHNHPSGNVNPSKADIEMTFVLKDALALVGIQVLDHIVVGRELSLSMAELGVFVV
jgi:DNA repair protein RadC